MSIAPVTLFDSFSRTSASSWGTMDSGASWNTTDSHFTVSPVLGGVLEVPTGSGVKNTYVNFGSIGVGNQDTAEVLMRFDCNPTGNMADLGQPATDFGPMLNRTSNNTFYFASVQISNSQVHIGAYVNGNRYLLDTQSFSLSKAYKYWIRFQKGADTLRLRIWREGTREPSSWTCISGEYKGTGAPGDGDIGVFRNSTATQYNAHITAFYGYTLDDTQAQMPIFDTFARTVSRGAGMSTSNHLWEGSFAMDPEIYKSGYNNLGSVANIDGGAFAFSIPDTNFYVNWLGPSLSVPVEAVFEVDMNTNAGDTFLLLGILGQKEFTAAGDAPFHNGYQIEFKSAATSIRLQKRITSTSTLQTSAAIPAIQADTKYKIRFQCISNVIRARIWLSSVAEPGTWDINYTDNSSPISSGRLWFAVSQSAAATKMVRIYDVSYGRPAAGADTTGTVTGALSTTAITDTTASLQSAFGNDSDANNSIIVEYKKQIEAAWTTFGGTKTRNSGNYTFTLTGLTHNTPYNVRVTYADASGVYGTNPVALSFTTTNLGITTAPLTITSVGSTSVDLLVAPSGDTNTNATLTVDRRTTGDWIPFIQDGFDGYAHVPITGEQAEIGGTWIRHPESSDNAFLYRGARGRVYVKDDLADVTNGVYYNNQTPPQSAYRVSGYVYASSVSGLVLLTARTDPVTFTFYYAGFVRAGEDEPAYFVIGRFINDVGGSFQAVPFDIELNESYFLEFDVRDDVKILYVNGEEKCRTTDNTLTTTGYAGMWLSKQVEALGTEFNQWTIDDFKVENRTFGGSWTSVGTMTYNVGPATYTRTVSGLTAGTGYELRATYADTNGVYGPNPVSVTVMTVGQAVEPSHIISTPSSTTAIIEAYYTLDTNDDSDCAFQYRSVLDKAWTTVSPNNIKIDRANKRFIAILSNLKASMTYDIKAIFSDPNGFAFGAESTLRATMSTLGHIEDVSKQTKHYLWKVYDTDQRYVTTWHDAGEPEFAWHENGGVTDLSVTLPRRFNSLTDPNSGVGFRNRVDIWCSDPSSEGFGENLVLDPEFNLEAWVLGSHTVFMLEGGPDDSHCMRITAPSSAINTTRSSPINVFTGLPPEGESNVSGGADFDPLGLIDIDSNNLYAIQTVVRKAPPVPIIVTAMARAIGGKMVMYVEAYNDDEEKIAQSDEYGETVGTDWQKIQVEWTPPPETRYLVVAFENDGAGTMYADKCYMRQKELLLYRGRIESFTPRISEEGEDVQINVLGLISQLSDDYIEFLQYVAIQPNKDLLNERENRGPADPSQMMRDVIDIARLQNPSCELYWTDESIKSTGTIIEYTFRDQQLRACFDKIRDLCPPNWHYFIDPDGRVNLRGPEHGKTHLLRIGVEILEFSVEKSIMNLKNFIHVKGRQDEDGSEQDGHGSIHYFAFDQASIDKYGKRMMFIRDAQITDPDTAQTVGEGRLVENNREEQRINCNIPDEKSIQYVGGSLKGYNIEEFRPGDQVQVLNPQGAPNLTYWDSLVYDRDEWDYSSELFILPESVPIKTIQFHGRFGTLELSERPPKSTSDFRKLYRMLQLKESDDSE